MFGIGRMFGGLAKILGGQGPLTGIAPLLNNTLGSQQAMLRAISGLLSKDFDVLKGVLQKMGAGGPAVPGGLGGMAGLGNLDLQALQSSADRIAFVAVLQRALTKAGSQKHFNLETAINDLWVSASNLRNGTQSLQASQARLSAPGAAAAPGGGLIGGKMEQVRAIFERLKDVPTD